MTFHPNAAGKLPSASVRVNAITLQLRTLRWVADKGEDKPTLFLWNGIIYRKMALRSFRYLMQRVFERCGWLDWKKAYGDEAYEQTSDRVYELTREAKISLNDHPNIIAFTNGYFNIESCLVEDPDPDLYITQQLTVPYVGLTNCPNFKAMVDKILKPQYRKKVLSMMGRCLTAGIYKGIAQVWTGAGKNGKSELTNILSLIVGDDVSHVPMGKLLNKNNRFATSSLKGKKVNIGSEITPKEVAAGGIAEVKRILTNRYIDGEKKGKDAQEWINTTKHIFDINATPLPSVYMDYAFFRRFQIIPFTTIIDENEVIEEYGRKVYDLEGPAIACYLLTFLRDAKDHIREEAAQSERDWHFYTQSVYSFLEFYCHAEEGEWTSTTTLFERYEDYCADFVRVPVSKILFGKLLGKNSIARRRIDGVYGYSLKCYYPLELGDPYQMLSDAQLEEMELQIDREMEWISNTEGRTDG
jgi:P4 family phage/plasmid primase-like protien